MARTGDGRNGFAHRCLAQSAGELPTRRQAEARRGELNAAKHTPTGTAALADACKAGARTFGEYAVAWLDAQRKKVATGALKQSTYEKYAYTLHHYVLTAHGDRAIGAITPEALRCLPREPRHPL